MNLKQPMNEQLPTMTQLMLNRTAFEDGQWTFAHPYHPHHMPTDCANQSTDFDRI